MFALAVQAAITPTVCYEPNAVTLTGTLTNDVAVNADNFRSNSNAPSGYYRVVLNPGGTNQETLPLSYLSPATPRLVVLAGTGFPSPHILVANAHTAGEPILFIADGQAVFGYNNPGAPVTINRGTSSGNYFFPAPPTYTVQTTNFNSGVVENAFAINAISGLPFTWFLDGDEARFNVNTTPICGTINYQGRRRKRR